MAYRDKVLAMHPSELSGYWQLADGAGASQAADSSGNAYNGVPHSVIFGQAGVDAANSALFRCGSCIDIYSPQNATGLAGKFNGNEYSQVLWFKIIDQDLWRLTSPDIVAHVNDPTDVRLRLLLLYGDTNNSISMRKYDANDRLRWDHFANPDRLAFGPLWTTMGLDPSAWTFMGMTYDLISGNMICYVAQGGVLSTHTTGGGSTSFGSALTQATIGAAQNNGQDHWWGWIQDVARWDNRILTGPEMTTLCSRT